MKLPALVCVLVCLLSAPKLKSQEFKGLHEISILVEHLNAQSQAIGLNEESLRNQVLVALKRDIPKLNINDLSPIYIYVRVTTVKVGNSEATFGIASFVEVSLCRPVLLSRENPTIVKANVWHTGMLLTSNEYAIASEIRSEIDDELTEFAAKYYKDNP